MFLNKNEMDITDVTSIRDVMTDKVLQKYSDRDEKTIIINCAAYTKVNDAENNVERTFDINVQGVKNLKDWCDRNNGFLIQISTDYVFDRKDKNVPYLEQMGANIKIDGRKIEINGPTSFKGCEVHATDLRAGASLVVAALAAEGETTIKDCEHILRGYDNMIEKLTRVGSDIKMID